MHPGAFVWADSADSDFDSTGNNQFLIRASGGVGIGPPSPQGGLHLRGAGFPHSFAFLDGDGGNNDAGLRLLRQGSTKWHFFNSASNDGLQIRPVDFGPVLVIAQNGRVGIGTANPQGRLDVNGPIYQRGGVLHADYVFEPGYQLESIEENARRMWRYGRLPAVPPGRWMNWATKSWNWEPTNEASWKSWRRPTFTSSNSTPEIGSSKGRSGSWRPGWRRWRSG